MANMDAFIYEALASRVIFGEGKLSELKDETKSLGQRALVLSTANHVSLAERAARLLEDLAVGIHDKALMHVPQKKH